MTSIRSNRVWGNLKGTELANLCLDTIEEAAEIVEEGLCRIGGEARLCFAFLRHCDSEDGPRRVRRRSSVLGGFSWHRFHPEGSPRSWLSSWTDRVVPVTVEVMAGESDAFELFLGYLCTGLVVVPVAQRTDSSALLGGGRRDELDDRPVGNERSPAPVHRDEAEHAVLDLVPLRGARRVVGIR
jgi:hypothetical protein